MMPTVGVNAEQQPIKKNQKNNMKLRATTSAGCHGFAEQPPLTTKPRFSGSPAASNTNQLQGSMNSSAGSELAELLSQHQEKQLHSMKSMDNQLRKWNSCSFLGENDLSKAEMNGFSPMHASAEQINQMNGDNVRMANATPSGQVTSLIEQGI